MHRRELLGGAAALAVTAQTGRGTPAKPDEPAPLTLEDLRTRPIIGRLGLPLGTDVLLNGSIEYRRSRRNLKTFGYSLRVTHLNRRPWTDDEPYFDLPNDLFGPTQDRGPSAESDAVGQAVEVVAYEAGEFWGLTASKVPLDAYPPPPEWAPVLPPLGGPHFHFEPTLRVVDILRGPTWKPP